MAERPLPVHYLTTSQAILNLGAGFVPSLASSGSPKCFLISSGPFRSVAYNRPPATNAVMAGFTEATVAQSQRNVRTDIASDLVDEQRTGRRAGSHELAPTDCFQLLSALRGPAVVP